jgi:Flp pilus assembly protein TadB
MTAGLLLTVVVVAGILLHRLVWADRRERRRQFPTRVD